jgi:hypothetical protein
MANTLLHTRYYTHLLYYTQLVNTILSLGPYVLALDLSYLVYYTPTLQHTPTFLHTCSDIPLSVVECEIACPACGVRALHLSVHSTYMRT